MKIWHFAMMTVLMTGLGPSVDVEPEELRCGLYCLTVAAKALGHKVDLNRIEKTLGEPSSRGYSMERLNSAARSLGISTALSQTTLEQLKYRHDTLGERFVCLTLINGDHFVLLTDIEKASVSICDPPKSYALDHVIFEKSWKGQVLLMSDRPLVTEEAVLGYQRRRALTSRFGVALSSGLFVFGVIYTINRFRKPVKAALDV